MELLCEIYVYILNMNCKYFQIMFCITFQLSCELIFKFFDVYNMETYIETFCYFYNISLL